jgi:hypothetical protein
MSDLIAVAILIPFLVAALAFPAVLVWFVIQWLAAAILDGLNR